MPKTYSPKELIPLVPKITFSDVKKGKMCKIIYPSLNGERIRFQAAKDSSPLTAPFGLSEPFAGSENNTKRTLEFSVADPDLLTLLRKLDERCKEVGLNDKLEALFGKAKEGLEAKHKEAAEGKYRGLLREPSSASYQPLMHTKYKLPDSREEQDESKDQEDGQSKDEPSKIWILKETVKVLGNGEKKTERAYEKANHTDIFKMSKHVPICELCYLYSTSSYWGPTLVTVKTIMFNKPGSGELEEFSLTSEAEDTGAPQESTESADAPHQSGDVEGQTQTAQ